MIFKQFAIAGCVRSFMLDKNVTQNFLILAKIYFSARTTNKIRLNMLMNCIHCYEQIPVRSFKGSKYLSIIPLLSTVTKRGAPEKPGEDHEDHEDHVICNLII